MNEVPIEQLNYARFAPLLNAKFWVFLDASNRVELELAKTVIARPKSAGGTVARDPSQAGFSLLFRGPDTRFLPQATYHFEQAELGRFDLFIVPVGRAPGSYEYEAVFNRLGNGG